MADVFSKKRSEIMSKIRSKDTGLFVLTLSSEYLYLVKNVVDENIKRGNPHMIISNKMLIDKEYQEMTKWSDFNISCPILFNFYHGLELFLKGFLILKESYILEPSHCIKELFKEFKDNYGEKKRLIHILNKYLEFKLMPKFLADCLEDNNLQIDNLYEFFRYPSDKKFQKEHNYSKLQHQEERGLTFFKEFSNDIDILLKEAVRLFMEIEKRESILR